MKQTPMQWMEEQLKMILPINQMNDLVIQDLFRQAKEMEKQQIFDAYYEGNTNGAIRVYNRSMRDDKSAEEYYNETFKEKQ